jgi:PAB1-binding protein PBP1
MQSNAEGNIHVAEERGQVMLRDNEDEEILYSGVIRKSKKLNNPKKFKCFHTKLVKIPEKLS